MRPNVTLTALPPQPFPALTPEARAMTLNRLYEGLDPIETLTEAIRQDFSGRVALVSSFGAQSAVLLHMVAQVDPATPVLFLQTQMLFAETLAYQRNLAARLGLTDVRVLHPDPDDLARHDSTATLHTRDIDGCCHIRKVLPLERALAGFDAWITGRKRQQSATRSSLQRFEADGEGRIKLNPLADWESKRLHAYMQHYDLPPHPLLAQGYPSIGCWPCTSPVEEGEDERAGRWRGADKMECGIHFENGRWVRTGASPRCAPMD